MKLTSPCGLLWIKHGGPQCGQAPCCPGELYLGAVKLTQVSLGRSFCCINWSFQTCPVFHRASLPATAIDSSGLGFQKPAALSLIQACAGPWDCEETSQNILPQASQNLGSLSPAPARAWHPLSLLGAEG